MRVEFLGVGEACDELQPNTSLLVECPSGLNRTLLLDCGFTAPSQFFKRVQDPDLLDAIWISHFHGDHDFGLPQLLLRLWEMGRTKPLTCIAQPGIEGRMRSLLDLAYPGLSAQFPFGLDWADLVPGTAFDLNGLNLQAAQTDHPRKNLALRLKSGDRSLFYSGDGKMTPASRELAFNCSLAVHEAFTVEPLAGGHSSVQECLDMAVGAGVQALALVHIQRSEREKVKQLDARELQARAGCPVHVPEPGFSLTLE
jgi:ribonuclease BN (tRNA processing enzyme)